MQRALPTAWVRARALAAAVFYALVPWPLYERECHHAPQSYGGHLVLNIRYAVRWALGRQSYGDVRFEVEKNGSGRWRRRAHQRGNPETQGRG